MKLYRDRNLLEIVKEGQVDRAHRITEGSIKYRFSVVKSYLKWLKANYGVSNDFSEVLKLKKSKCRGSTSVLDPFTQSDLKTLFHTRHHRKGRG